MTKIIQAKVKEASEIKKLLKETWTTTYSKIYSPEVIELITSEWHSIGLLTQQIQNPKILFLVAKDDKKIIGMCNTAVVNQDNIINIQRIHVLPLYQRQGIGSALMKEVLKSYPKIIRVELEVEKQNLQAQNFYIKQGFKIAREKTFIVKGVKIECFVMEKTLIKE